MVYDLAALLAGKDMVQELHRHSFYFILVIEWGSGRHVIDFAEYDVTGGSVFVLRPGQVHELALKKHCKGFLLQFSEGFAGNIDRRQLKDVSRKNCYLPDPRSFENILALVKAFYVEDQARDLGFEQALQANMQLLLIALLRLGRTGLAQDRAGDDGQAWGNQQRLDAFQDLIAEHFAKHKEVKWYAAQLHLTPYQLNAVTQTTLGKKASDLISDHILLEARRHLLATSDTIGSIAGHLGYEDVSYFIRFFRKQTGSTPGEYRNRHKSHIS